MGGGFVGLQNQDKWGIQGSLVSMGDGSHTIAKPLSDGSFAVALWNLNNNATANVSVSWSDLGPGAWTGGTIAATVRDIWERRDLGVFAGDFTATVPGHGVAIIKATPKHRHD